MTSYLKKKPPDIKHSASPSSAQTTSICESWWSTTKHFCSSAHLFSTELICSAHDSPLNYIHPYITYNVSLAGILLVNHLVSLFTSQTNSEILQDPWSMPTKSHLGLDSPFQLVNSHEHVISNSGRDWHPGNKQSIPKYRDTLDGKNQANHPVIYGKPYVNGIFSISTGGWYAKYPIIYIQGFIHPGCG